MVTQVVEEQSRSPLIRVVLEATGAVSGFSHLDTPAREDAPHHPDMELAERNDGRVCSKYLPNSDAKTGEIRDEIMTPIDTTGRVGTLSSTQLSHSATITHTSSGVWDKADLGPQSRGLTGALEVDRDVEVASSNNTENDAPRSALEVDTTSLNLTMASTCGPDGKSERLSPTYHEAVEKDTKDDVLCETKHTVTTPMLPETVFEEPLSPLTELTSDSASNDGSDRGDCSSDATSPDTSEHLYFDCVIAPPFRLPREIYRPMKEACPNAVTFVEGGSQTGYDSESASSTGSTSPSDKSVGSRLSSPLPQLTEDSDHVDDGFFNARQRNPKPAPGGRKRKLRHRSRSRSRSPLHLYEEEEALNLFGPTLTLYSVGGPPGGFPIGVATLQCPPEAGAHASFNLNVDDEMQCRLIEARAEAAAELEQKMSQTAQSRRRFSKPQTARRKGEETVKQRWNDVNQGTTKLSTCHACSKKTDRPKMKCSASRRHGTHCMVRFCDRCIERKFPEINFDAHAQDFVCPRCTGTCPCMPCKQSQAKERMNLDDDETHKSVTITSAALPLPSSSRSQPSNIPAKRKSKLAVQSGKLEHEPDGEYSETEHSLSESSSEEFVSPMVRDKRTTSCAPTKHARKRNRQPRATNLILSNVQDSDRKTCHQCRNRNVYAKMYCSSTSRTGRTCTAAYCHRCISTRYPGFSFTPEGSFICFRCLNNCSCDICTRGRGEDYTKSSSMYKANTENSSLRITLAVHHRTAGRVRPSLQSAEVKSERVTEIGEDAKEWMHSHRSVLSGNDQDNNEIKGQIRTFVGAWQPFWGSMKEYVEMDSAATEMEPACPESSRGSKSYLYAGRPISVRRPLEALNGTNEAIDSILAIAQSRSGRTIRPSEKVKQYRSGSDDEFASPPARRKRRKLTASSTRPSTLSSLSTDTQICSTNDRLELPSGSMLLDSLDV